MPSAHPASQFPDGRNERRIDSMGLRVQMSSTELGCPSCESKQIVKNEKTHTGKQNHKCRDCGRQFVEDSQLVL